MNDCCDASISTAVASMCIVYGAVKHCITARKNQTVARLIPTESKTQPLFSTKKGLKGDNHAYVYL